MKYKVICLVIFTNFKSQFMKKVTCEIFKNHIVIFFQRKFLKYTYVRDLKKLIFLMLFFCQEKRKGQTNFICGTKK